MLIGVTAPDGSGRTATISLEPFPLPKKIVPSVITGVSLPEKLSLEIKLPILAARVRARIAVERLRTQADGLIVTRLLIVSTRGVENALRKSPSPRGVPSAFRSLKFTSRSVRQIVCPSNLSSATMN